MPGQGVQTSGDGSGIQRFQQSARLIDLDDGRGEGKQIGNLRVLLRLLVELSKTILELASKEEVVDSPVLSEIVEIEILQALLPVLEEGSLSRSVRVGHRHIVEPIDVALVLDVTLDKAAELTRRVVQ